MEEHEYKYMLDKVQYEAILENLRIKYNIQEKPKVQINYYFDTDEFHLSKEDITLRIRQIDSNLYLQLKTPIARDNSLSIKKEYNKTLSTFTNTIDLKNQEFSHLLPCSGKAYLIGSTVTERTKFNIEDGIEIDVDKNSYLGFVDYELEIEFDVEKKQKVQNIIKSINKYNVNPSEHGKKTRFFNRYREFIK